MCAVLSRLVVAFLGCLALVLGTSSGAMASTFASTHSPPRAWSAAQQREAALGGDAGAQRQREGASLPYRVSQERRVSTPFRLLGQVFDEESGLAWTRFRVWDAATGRWLSPDPMGWWGGLNLYAFSGTPAHWVDPWGLTGDPHGNGGASDGAGTAAPPAASGTAPVTDVEGSTPPFRGTPGSTARGQNQSRTYGPDGFPLTDRDPGHPDEAGIGAGDHCHDWSRPEGGGPPTAANRGTSRLPTANDPPPPRGPGVPPPSSS